MTAQSLLSALQARSPALTETLRGLYGDDPALLEDRRRAYEHAVQEFCVAFDPGAEVVVSRAPGRANLLGRHVDHRGGFVNPIALNLEVVLVAQARDDDRFVVRNCDPAYPPREFALRDELPPAKIRDLGEWDEWTLDRLRQRQEEGLGGHWTVYVQGAAVSFQDLLRAETGELRPPLKGMNAVATGNLPASAGLSSSSAVFVSAAEAILHFNGVRYPPSEFADRCGRGEWYLGTRGGSGDHAAMKFGRRGQISHVGFFPTTISHVGFPADYRIVIADSKDQAKKAEGARDRFNQRVAAYEFGLMLLRERFPAHADKLAYLRDANVETLGCDEGRIYEMLKALPVTATRQELRAVLPASQQDRLEEIFAAHAEPREGYLVRDVCLFGVAECLRSRDCFSMLESGDIAGFGELMTISHDGDRVCRQDQAGNSTPFGAAVSDRELDRLIAASRAGDPAAALIRQPGKYACSTPRVDRMVDLALSTPGVMGAQLSGAGLGGCMMALVHREHADELIDLLTTEYYTPLHLDPSAYVCTPVEGAGIVPVG